MANPPVSFAAIDECPSTGVAQTEMSSLCIKEGFVPFQVENLSCETWYKVVGVLSNTEAIPLVVLHGGPGACHEYLLPLQALATPTRPIIFYDQIGNGRSTHLRHLRGDEKFWTVKLFMDELSNLLSHLGLDSRAFDLHGQSWGGMLGAEYAIWGQHRQRIRKLVLANSLASNPLYMKGTDIEIRKFPQHLQEAIAEARSSGNYDTEGCNAAVDYFLRHLFSVAEPWPVPPLAAALEWLTKDDTTYFTIYGPNVLSPTGVLREWSIAEEVHKITAQTLVMMGELEGAQLIAAQPFIDNIKGAKSVIITGAAHMSHLDQPAKCLQVIGEFLNET
ncbi:hypothetical protein NLG97_g1996 [Lecanicillium saksenae]|uniref:Uncharacterized protein n=1 Tax=Lecanicillium saksenae TaxID=468837 RepID=A0ACC1R5G1_9HYPO|nr:hypothetical protein NLG97_g1996 [Lecanicillium saksenae]